MFFNVLPLVHTLASVLETETAKTYTLPCVRHQIVQPQRLLHRKQDNRILNEW